MPSDLHNSTMAKAMGLIFSLFDVDSAPFAILLYIVFFSDNQCISRVHGAIVSMQHEWVYQL